MNYKFLPIGGTDFWSHYPAAGPLPEVGAPWSGEPAQSIGGLGDLLAAYGDATARPGEDQMIGSPRPVGPPPAEDWMIGSPRPAGPPPAEDWMVGSPHPAGEPGREDQDDAHSAAPEGDDAELAAARARYREAVAALDDQAYAVTPFNDSTMAAPTH